MIPQILTNTNLFVDGVSFAGDVPSLTLPALKVKTQEYRAGETHKISPNGFHIFAASWDPQEIIWYVDGREVRRQPTPPDMNKPMYLLANLAVGGHWPGAPDASTSFPARMSIDYIRAYKFVQ